MPQKIGVNLVFASALAEIGPRADARDPHLTHVVLDGLAVDAALQLQHGRDLARTVKGMGRVQLVDAALESQVVG